LSNLKAGFTIYPNPTSDVFYIKYADEKPIQFTLFNSLGQIVYADDNYFSDQKINIKQLQKGMFFYRIETSKGTHIGKIIKH
jgi:hypothetical protein